MVLHHVKGVEPRHQRKLILSSLLLLFLTVFVGVLSAQGTIPALSSSEGFRPFSFMTDPKFSSLERVALFVVLGIALAGLCYALLLVGQIRKADRGTKKMQDIADAVREGSAAYLRAQFKRIAPLMVVITVILYFTASSPNPWFHFGRAGAFIVGATFSWLVGFIGMKLATQGNLRVAAAARTSYGDALQLGYRTGTITGMLTDGLGLLGGTLIFLMYGEQAYEALLGFGFGGTLLALFMRVGGGIYTKAADVGADLVGKIEKDIPEDDPRNAATIADNVGDNVGDCAGMASDIFESYEVTIVAAMILGLATFGHIGVMFPLLVRGIGVLGSIISTYTVRAKADDTSDIALKNVHRGFWIGSAISIIGFMVLGFFYLRSPKFADMNLPWWSNFGLAPDLDLRPALTCFVGVALAIVLNKVTSYYTHTSNAPVKGLTKACQTGHATNIIQGIALGYESAVAICIVIATAIALSVMIYAGANPLYVAYGVAMTGIGMLTLTGNTISMDVFGPVADNANGIGEMGYDKEEMEKEKPGSYAHARQILADLDAVGNTTKAETKGIAIGSAVIAAVSLFASFIAVIAMGSEDKIGQMDLGLYNQVAGMLSVAKPEVIIGLLIGGAVPFLFSSMLIRAVGRAAYLIVRECREQFKDDAIWKGTKKPDYSRVVNICTKTAQSELVGPGFLAILSPVLVGFLLGPFALGGFLAGAIIVGLLLAVFMANAGGAWDNAKKSVEDGLYGGKGSDAHKAAITGDTVGDPLKDTAGPAINPLIKVMNMVSLLTLVPVMKFGLYTTNQSVPNGWIIAIVVIILCVAAIGYAVYMSRVETKEMLAIEAELAAKADS